MRGSVRSLSPGSRSFDRGFAQKANAPRNLDKDVGA
jgi:hypothetical protein